ncbi:MAG: DUF2304 domain-containing protein [Candidatus Omnitrophota bacterium]
MPLIQKVFFYIVALSIFVLVLNLVRKRQLKESYSWLWIIISVSLFLLISQYSLLTRVSRVLQVTPSIVILFMGVIALLLLVLQLFLINCAQSVQIKNMAQRMALLEEKMDRDRRE